VERDLSVFGVPNPQATPTNLLYNVLSGPGALFQFARQGQLRGPLASSCNPAAARALGWSGCRSARCSCRWP
jgi:hypothetical protein